MHVLKQYQDLNLATSKLISRTKKFHKKDFLKHAYAMSLSAIIKELFD